MKPASLNYYEQQLYTNLSAEIHLHANRTKQSKRVKCNSIGRKEDGKPLSSCPKQQKRTHRGELQAYRV